MPPRCDEVCDLSQFGFEKVLAWTGDDQDRGIIRQLALGEQVERLHHVILAFDGAFGFGVPLPLGIVDRVLAMSFEEVHHFFALANDLQEGVREVLLVGNQHLLLFFATLQHDRAIGGNAVAFGHARVAVWIDELIGKLFAVVGILIQKVLSCLPPRLGILIKRRGTFTGCGRCARSCWLCGDNEYRLLAVRSKRWLWRREKASTKAIIPNTAMAAISRLVPNRRLRPKRRWTQDRPCWRASAMALSPPAMRLKRAQGQK